jgi:hypothetical protein
MSQWLTPVILATQEAEIRRMVTFQRQSVGLSPVLQSLPGEFRVVHCSLGPQEKNKIK